MSEPVGAPITFRDLAGLGVESLTGVGPKKLASLHAVGIDTVLDVLMHYPRRYLDRTHEARIADLAPGETAMVLGTVRRCDSRRVRGGRVVVTATLSDGINSLKLSFFNQAWRERQLTPGTEAVVFGKVELFGGARQMTNPVVDLVGDRTGRIIAVYPQSEKSGLTTWELGGYAAQVVRRCTKRGLADPVPPGLRTELGLIGRFDAFVQVHAPDTMADTTDARRRLVFDELFRLQVSLVDRKVEMERTQIGLTHVLVSAAGQDLVAKVLGALPFELTTAQSRVLDEIRSDLVRSAPMHRLVQGDVGSGKTVVALGALLIAVQGGHQGAFMAPTEVLAQQHARSLCAMVDGVTVSDPGTLSGERPLRLEVFSGRSSAAERRRLASDLAEGQIDIAVGTHALIQEGIGFASLGVAVIDEQHRFGVHQRDALRARNADGSVPDVLVMTATPIPRTAAMTVYGDLDVSTLDELPPGRTPIVTHHVDGPVAEAVMWTQVREEVAAGRQAYVVCPLVEESEKLEVASAIETLERLQSDELAGLHVELLHGRMTGAEKDDAMQQFSAGRIDVLVATTVIEVGVDVANATVMVILDADRFGIAQLHQLRGRVGRGAAASSCWLVADDEITPDAAERLAALVRTTDGFELAEVDLDLRGEGTILGDRQKGRNDLKLASLRRDREWVEKARAAALEVVGQGDWRESNAVLADEIDLLLAEGDTDFLMKN